MSTHETRARAAWTRRAALAAGLASLSTQARAGGLETLLSDGPDGVLSAGVIARHGDGSVALAGAAGRRMTGDRVATFGLDDPFRTASISKMVTATGFMRLVEAGRVRLEDDVGDRLGFALRHPAWPDRPITVRMLLSHLSGLRNGPSYPVPAGHRLAEAFTPEGRHWDGGAWFSPASEPPGDWWAYADVNFALLGQIAERITGQRFDLWMGRTVLRPLGLDAGYNWSGVSQARRDRAASARRWIDGDWMAQTDAAVPAAPAVVYPQPGDAAPVAERDLRPGENGFLFSPLGGLRVSLGDLDRLAQFYRGGGRLGGTRILKRSSLELMQAPAWRYDPARPNGDPDGGVLRGYGLGVECPQGAPGPDGDAFFGGDSAHWRGHLGDAYGWMTGLFWNRRDGRTLCWALNGVRETGRAEGRRSALSAPEEAIIDRGLAAFAARA